MTEAPSISRTPTPPLPQSQRRRRPKLERRNAATSVEEFTRRLGASTIKRADLPPNR